jgi:hypothetical protein
MDHGFHCGVLPYCPANGLPLRTGHINRAHSGGGFTQQPPINLASPQKQSCANARYFAVVYGKAAPAYSICIGRLPLLLPLQSALIDAFMAWRQKGC